MWHDETITIILGIIMFIGMFFYLSDKSQKEIAPIQLACENLGGKLMMEGDINPLTNDLSCVNGTTLKIIENKGEKLK